MASPEAVELLGRAMDECSELVASATFGDSMRAHLRAMEGVVLAPELSARHGALLFRVGESLKDRGYYSTGWLCYLAAGDALEAAGETAAHVDAMEALLATARHADEATSEGLALIGLYDALLDDPRSSASDFESRRRTFDVSRQLPVMKRAAGSAGLALLVQRDMARLQGLINEGTATAEERVHHVRLLLEAELLGGAPAAVESLFAASEYLAGAASGGDTELPLRLSHRLVERLLAEHRNTEAGAVSDQAAAAAWDALEDADGEAALRLAIADVLLQHARLRGVIPARESIEAVLDLYPMDSFEGAEPDLDGMLRATEAMMLLGRYDVADRYLAALRESGVDVEAMTAAEEP